MSTPTTQQDVEKSPELATSNQVLLTHQSLEAEYDDNSRVPQLSILQIFWLFFSQFSIFAWGGPVAQIALIKERLVVKDQWITMARFLACTKYSLGRKPLSSACFLGAWQVGDGEDLPRDLASFYPVLCLCWPPATFTSLLGLGTPTLMRPSALCSLWWRQWLVHFFASMGQMFKIRYGQILRATHKIAEHALVSHETKKPSVWLVLFALFTVLNSALRINWYRAASCGS